MTWSSTALMALVAGQAMASPLAAQELVIESWRNDDITIWRQFVTPAFAAQYPEIAVRFQPTPTAEDNAASSAELDGGIASYLVSCRPFDASASNEPGLDWRDEDGRLALISGKPRLTDEACVALDRTLARRAEYAPSGLEAQAYPDSQNLFALGRAAVLPTGSWKISPFQRDSFASGSNEASAVRGKVVSSDYLGRRSSRQLEFEEGSRIVVEVPAENAVMATVRQGFLADDRPIEVIQSIYRTARYDVVAEMRLGQG